MILFYPCISKASKRIDLQSKEIYGNQEVTFTLVIEFLYRSIVKQDRIVGNVSDHI